MRRIHRENQWTIILFGLFFIFGSWFYAWQRISYEYEMEIDNVYREGMNLSIVLEAQARRVIKEAEYELHHLSIMHEMESESGTEAMIGRYLEQLRLNLPIRQAALSDEQGNMHLFLNPEASLQNIANKEYFRQHQFSNTNQVYIGKPDIETWSQKPVIPLSVRINKPDGSFGGIAYMSLDPDYFSHFFRQMALGPNKMILLAGMDGIVRLRQHGEDWTYGQDIGKGPLMAQARQSPAGTLKTKTILDGVVRIQSYRVLPEYDFMVNIGIAEEDALQGYMARKRVYLEVAFFSTIVIIAACLLLFDAQNRIIRQNQNLKGLSERLQYIGFHDSLTGLYNRTYFEEEIRRLDKSAHPGMAIVVFDLDGLKLINDSFGHEHGDQMLKQAAAILQRCFQQGDIVARIGGDEFAAIMTDTTRADIERACNRVKEEIGNYNREEEGIPLSISIGYALAERPGAMRELYKEADNNMYREKLHRSQSIRSTIVRTVMKLLEVRDHITEGHADRLQDIVAGLGRALRLPEGKIADLRLLAQFHDIGKVGIPDCILLKPGPLNPEERVEMQRHCEIGQRIALSSPALSPIADGILKHQEWWDGSGYPLGLAGEKIPLECRILAIADAYDAMTSDRPYRKAMSKEAAIGELIRYAGTQFDPVLVEKFLEYMAQTES